MKIVVAGASGLHRRGRWCRAARRRAPGHPAGPPDAAHRRRAPLGPPAPAARPGAPLAGVDAVINLAGAAVGDRPLDRAATSSDAADQPGRQHRDRSARRCRGCGATRPPRCCCPASAVGFYGDTGDRPVDEESRHGQRVPRADLLRVWEAAARPPRTAGIRVALLRTGLVLDRDGGLLERMLPIFRLGLGGRLGIRAAVLVAGSPLADWVHAITAHPGHSGTSIGPVNLTAPEPGHQRRVHHGRSGTRAAQAHRAAAGARRFALSHRARQSFARGEACCPGTGSCPRS